MTARPRASLEPKWWYKDMKPFTNLEWVSSSAIGGGYGTTAIAIGDAMKKEELVNYNLKN